MFPHHSGIYKDGNDDVLEEAKATSRVNITSKFPIESLLKRSSPPPVNQAFTSDTIK